MMRQWIAVHKPVEGTFSANFVTSFRPFCKSDIRKASATKIQKGLGTNGGKAIISREQRSHFQQFRHLSHVFSPLFPLVSFSLYLYQGFPRTQAIQNRFFKEQKRRWTEPRSLFTLFTYVRRQIELFFFFFFFFFFLSECAVLGFGLCRFASLALKKGNL